MYENEFRVLEIEKTRDEAAIRMAYRQKLMVTNPEDKPEEFKQLRAAYEAALKYAKEGEPEQQEEAVFFTQGLSESPVTKWMDQVREVCSLPQKRYSVDEWRKLLSEDACNDFDTSGEASVALFRYLMEHYYLTAEIFRMLDDKFDIQKDEAEWKEKLPAGFVNYMLEKIKDEKGDTDFSFEWLTGEAGMDFDGYVRNLEELNNRLWEKNLEQSEQLLKNLDATGIWHPFRDLGEMRLKFLKAPEHRLLSLEREKILSRIRKLLSDYPTSRRIPLEAGEFLWWCEEYEESAKVYYDLSKRDSHFLIDKYLALYEYKNGNLKSAIRRLERIEEAGEVEVLEVLKEADEKYYAENEAKELHDPEELQLYLYSCLRLKKLNEIERVMKTNESFAQLEEKDFLLYRYYCELENLEGARKALRNWVEKTKTQNDIDGKSNHGIALLLLARHCLEGSSKIEAGREEWLLEAIDASEKARPLLVGRDARNLLACEFQELRALMELKRYEEAYKLSDRLLEGTPNLFQVIAQRQKCCMALHKAQEVVDLFHRGVALFQNQEIPEEAREDIISLYENAADVFQIFNQFSEAERVLGEAKEKGFSSAKLVLVTIFIERKRAIETRNQKQIRDAVDRIEEKIASMKKLSADGVSLSEAYHNKGLLENELKNEGDAAIKTLETALEHNRENTQALFYLGRLLLQKGRIEEAEKCFLSIEKIDGYSAPVYCNLVDCALRRQNVAEAVRLTEILLQNEENQEAYLDLYCDVYYTKMRKTELREDAERTLDFAKREIAYLEAKNENTIRYYSYRIEAEMILGKYDDALLMLDKMLKLVPENAYFLYQKSRLYYYLGDWENAAYYAKQAFCRASDQQHDPYLLQICVCTLHTKNPEQIKYWFDRYFAEAKGSKKLGYEIYCEFLRNADEPAKELEYVLKRSNEKGYEKQEESDSDLYGCQIRKYCGSRFKMSSLIRQRTKLIRKAPLLNIERDVALDYLFYLGNSKKAESHLLNWTELYAGTSKRICPFEAAILAMSYRDRKINSEVVGVYALLFDKLKKQTGQKDELEAVVAFLTEQVDYGKKRKMAMHFALLLAAAGYPQKARMLEEKATEYLPCFHCPCNLCVDREFLNGYLLETEGKAAEAMECYRRILEEFPAYVPAIWRIRHIKKNRS